MNGRLFFFTAIICAAGVFGENVTWKRQEPAARQDLQLFKSPHGISLPTAETMQKGNFEFEISHRFIPPFDEGIDVLYGFDGPVNMRLALGYAITDNFMVTVGRSNADKNLDFQLKYKLLQLRSSLLPTVLGVQVGEGWSALKTLYFNEDFVLIEQPRHFKRHFQYYLQGILNTRFNRRLCLGLVPSFLVNRDIRARQWTNSFVLGANGNLYIGRMLALVGEWAYILTDKYGMHNPGAVGLELNTGGHFFKVFMTNQVYLNSPQYLAGAAEAFAHDSVRFGFLVTRLIAGP